jgi:hypothetical protein
MGRDHGAATPHAVALKNRRYLALSGSSLAFLKDIFAMYTH